MARLNNKMKASPKAKTINVAFWNKQDATAAGEAIKRRKEGGHTNKSTDDFIKERIKAGEW